MKGSIAQSYFMFDNPQYKVARRIYFGLYQEEQEFRQQLEDDDNEEFRSDESSSEDFSESESGP